MGVTLKDVKELSNPSAPFKKKVFIASTYQRVSDINGEAPKKEEVEGRRRKAEKRDHEEQEKPAVPPVRLLRVRCSVRCASVFITP